ncbi:unnamed protein product [Coffea canephora]|uniref:Protein BIG GRAIN 1-like E n=1 Tax=Coffea canephora TaxID=49390 RepID=A0A068TW14_COFCA|nr:unnamed protein product [Coffea canephora]
MSIVGHPAPDKMLTKSVHRKNDSGELDVFEAAKYFSAANEIYAYENGAAFAQKGVRDHHHHQEKQASKAGRFSLDVPMRNSNSIPSQTTVMEKQMMIKEKKHKQPSSPGGKLANFLNSLFSQTSSRKKKSKSTTTTQSKKDDQDDQSPGWRRKRRSSISHFGSATNSVDSRSLYSTSSSGFRTPPPYAHTPTKTYKDLRSYSDHQQKQSQYSMDCAWLDDKYKLVDHNLQSFKNANVGYPQKIEANNWADRYLSEEKGFMKFNDADDGADSDSSSDLFELPNYDLDFYSSGLPVYETTNMDSIKRCAPISSAAAR